MSEYKRHFCEFECSIRVVAKQAGLKHKLLIVMCNNFCQKQIIKIQCAPDEEWTEWLERNITSAVQVVPMVAGRLLTKGQTVLTLFVSIS